MIWTPYKTNMPTKLPHISSSKGSSLWLLWILVYQGILLFTKPHFKGSRLGPRSYYLRTYFMALFLTIQNLALYFLQVFWLCSNIILKLRPIWSGHPVVYILYNSLIAFLIFIQNIQPFSVIGLGTCKVSMEGQIFICVEIVS